MSEEKSEVKEKSIAIRIAKDTMHAYITVSPQANEHIEYQDLWDALQNMNVTYGIDTDELSSIIDERRFFLEILIASGDEPTDGEDGYYEYLFDTNVDMKPKILADGSVDYKSMGQVPVVEENQEIVIYHPATGQTPGKSVLGLDILGKKGKDLMPLKGKGFLLSEDKTVYRAAMTGKITLKGTTLEVSNVLVINDDVTISTGGVTFAGDVIIKGNVLTGAEVRANGNIEINGCVEAATLIAGKNVTLKNGMQGNGKGIIHAGKNVAGKFFEQVTIEAKGNVSANAIMHCNIKCDEAINVAGKFGIIVGGRVEALREIEATLIGNMNEVKTIIEVGTATDLYAKMEQIEGKLKETQLEINKLLAASEKIASMLKTHPENEELKHTKINVMRAKIARDATLKDLEREKEEVVKVMAKVSNPKVIVLKSIYPGVYMSINGVKEKIKTENYNVTYRKNGEEIEFIANI